MKNHNVFLGMIFIVSYCIITAASSVLVSFFEKTISPISLAFYSFLVTMVFFNLFNLGGFKHIKPLYQKHLKLLVFLNIATAIMWLSVFYGLKFLNPDILTALFFGVMPIATILINFKQNENDKLRRLELFFSFILCLELILLCAETLFDAKNIWLDIVCLALALLSGVMAATANTLGYQLARLKYSATQILSQRFNLLILAAFLALLIFKPNLTLSLHHSMSVLLVALSSVILPLFFLQKGLENIDPIFVSFIAPFIPVITFFIQLLEPGTKFNFAKLTLLIIISFTICISSLVKTYYAKKS